MRDHGSKVAMLVLAAGLAACSSSSGGGGSTGSTGTVRLTGSYPAAAAAGAGLVPMAPAPPPDRIVAIPLDHGWFTGQLMPWSVSASLAGGTFALDLPKEFDWLLVLERSGTSGSGRFGGAVNLRTALDAGLIALPVSQAPVDAIAVGTITTGAGGDPMTVASVSSDVFRLTPDQLEALATSDDLFENAKNLVINYGTYGNAAGVWYQLRPQFSWDGEVDITSAWSDPANLRYLGMSFQLDSNSTAVGMDPLCSHSVVVTFEPPSAVTVALNGITTYDQANPITSADASCELVGSTARRWWSGSLYGSDEIGRVSYSIALSLFTNPGGLWTWREGGTMRAQFDVSGVNPPVDAAHAWLPAGFVPSFKVNTAADGRITSVDVRWFAHDPLTGAYGEVATQDLPVLAHFVHAVAISLGNESLPFNPATTVSVVPQRTWYYGRHAADPSLESGLMGFYETAGYGFFIHFRPPRTVY